MKNYTPPKLYERTHPDGASIFVHIKLPKGVTAIIGPFFYTSSDDPQELPDPLPDCFDDTETILTTIDLNWAIRGTAAGFPPANSDIITIDQLHLPLTLKGATIVDDWHQEEPNEGWTALAKADPKLLPLHMAHTLRHLHDPTQN